MCMWVSVCMLAISGHVCVCLCVCLSAIVFPQLYTYGKGVCAWVWVCLCMVKKGLKANIIQWSIDIVVTASIWTFCMRVKERERVRKNVNLLYFLRLLLASCHIDGSVVLLKVLIKKREEKKPTLNSQCACALFILELFVHLTLRTLQAQINILSRYCVWCN